MQSTDEILNWRGRTAYDRAGSKLGSVDEIYLDAESGQPEWAAVKTGLFGGKLTFVPLEGARERDDDVVLDWTEQVVKDAPRIDADGELSPEEEDRLYDHYELYDSPEYHGGRDDDEGRSGGGVREFTDRDRDGDRTDDRDRSSAGTGAAAGAGAGLGAAGAAGGGDRDDDDTGARREGTAGPTAGTGTSAGEADAGGETAGRGAPAPSGPGGTSPSGSGGSGQSAPDTGDTGGRRPRIKRYITEELGPDGNPVKRETRTEETFE